MSISVLSVAIALLLPVIILAIVYFGRLREHRGILDYAEAFLAGVIVSLVVLVLNSVLYPYLQEADGLLRSFVFAAGVEKIASFIPLFLLITRMREHSQRRAIGFGLLFAAAFSAVENLQYVTAFGSGVLLPRLLFSVPMHLATAGIMGHFIGAYTLNTRWRGMRIFAAFLVPWVIHGVFDFLLFRNVMPQLLVPPVIVLAAFHLEYLLSEAEAVPPASELQERYGGYTNWQTLRIHQRHERWISRAMGKEGAGVSLLRFHSGFTGIALSALVLALGIVLMSSADWVAVKTGIRLPERQMVMVFVSFPFTIAFLLLVRGIINPRWFTEGVLRIPVISNVVLRPFRDDEETLITYDISAERCFLKTPEPPAESVVEIRFESVNLISPIIAVRSVWSNADDPTMPLGVMVCPANPEEAERLSGFLTRYRIIKILSAGLIALGLPGKDRVRRLFIRPVSVMKKHLLVQRGGSVFSVGDRADYFYMIERGRVCVGRVSGRPDAVLKKGDFFGESDIVGSGRRSYAAWADTDAELVLADLSALKRLVENDPHFAYQMILSLSRQISALDVPPSGESRHKP